MSDPQLPETRLNQPSTQPPAQPLAQPPAQPEAAPLPRIITFEGPSPDLNPTSDPGSSPAPASDSAAPNPQIQAAQPNLQAAPPASSPEPAARLQTRRDPADSAPASSPRSLTPIPMPRPSTPSVTKKPGLPRKILVLGATSGIAEATCRIWAAEGASFFLIARNAEKLANVAADLKTRGASSVDTAVADLDDTGKHPALLAHAVNALSGMDVAFLTHGILGDQAAGEQDFEVAAQILHTNLLSVISLLTWLGNFCVQRRSGTLAVISSVAGERGRKSNYLYGASKAGLTAFLGGLRNRVDREGVHVLNIKPGPVKTSMTTGMKGSQKFADPNVVAQAIVKAVAARRDTLYTPIQWQPIMFVIRHIPERIFKKLNL